MAPEQCGETPRIETASDMWALGVTLLEACSGVQEFKPQTNRLPMAQGYLELARSKNPELLSLLKEDPTERYTAKRYLQLYAGSHNLTFQGTGTLLEMPLDAKRRSREPAEKPNQAGPPSLVSSLHHTDRSAPQMRSEPRAPTHFMSMPQRPRHQATPKPDQARQADDQRRPSVRGNSEAGSPGRDQPRETQDNRPGRQKTPRPSTGSTGDHPIGTQRTGKKRVKTPKRSPTGLT